jgi:3-ketosteroid 9alpha-monooxygenase subunit B
MTGPAPTDGFHRLRIARVVDETADARSFVLDVPGELRDAYAYRAGQYCTFRVPSEGGVLERCYSMSSAPEVDAALQVTVKRFACGVVSNWMNDRLAAGDEIDVSRPVGRFRLGDGGADVVAFSAGSGITPVFSIVKSALATTDRRVRLVYANRDAGSVIFAAALDGLAARHPDRFEVVHHLDADHGFITADAIRAQLRDGAEYYLCGPTPFMDLVEATLADAGVAPGRILAERFDPAGPEPAPVAVPSEPPAGDAPAGPREVTIELDGVTRTAAYRPGTTILQTARQVDLAAPFSCEAGNCATCMARVVEGRAEMHANNALTDDEVAEGWVLTCQAVPLTPVVRVVYGYEET